MKITPKNCLKASNEQTLDGNINDQARAWQTVFDFCVQKGMNDTSNRVGLEKVINFINELKIKSSTPQINGM